MAFLLPLFSGIGAAATSGAGVVSSLSAAGSLIGTGTAAGIASGIGMGIGALAPSFSTLASLGRLGAELGQARGIEQANKFNAMMAMEEAESREDLIRRNADRQLGTIRSQLGKSGATAQGTPILALAESASNAEIDALNARFSGMNQATLFNMQARNARRAGNLRAGTSLLSSFGAIS